jgi:hemerythrin-like domain-containing protein
MDNRPSTLSSRRAALTAAVGLGGALALAGCSKADGRGEGVPAVEDLMREHGVLRRILVVYREVALALRANPGGVDAAALGQAAALFKTFGEDYHERKLEERHIFPAVRAAGGVAAALVGTLLAQHDRGREITAFIQTATAGGGIGPGQAEPLARALETFARMYEAHTAFEDTIVFQAWRKSLGKEQLDRAGDQFEAIEREQFKGDGFDMAVDQVSAIERRLGLGDLARYTAPPVGG